MKDLRLFCQPVPVGFKNGPGVWLIVVRCQYRLVSPFLIEIQCSVLCIFAETKLHAAGFGARLFDDLADGLARLVLVRSMRRDPCDDVQLMDHDIPLVIMLTI